MLEEFLNEVFDGVIDAFEPSARVERPDKNPKHRHPKKRRRHFRGRSKNKGHVDPGSPSR